MSKTSRIIRFRRRQPRRRSLRYLIERNRYAIAALVALTAAGATFVATSREDATLSTSEVQEARATPSTPSAAELPSSAEVATSAARIGRASVIDGDTLEIRGERIRIHGVDAPESSQTCTDAEGKPWRCGQKAALALSDWLGMRTLNCERVDTDRYGRTVARCAVEHDDVGGWLVRNGWARAFARYSAAYLSEEAEAKAAKLGIWQGEHTAPWDWREQERSSRSTELLPLVSSTSSACAIKGNINSKGDCIYHVPGSRWYDETRVTPSKGEQYFCSVGEAIAAGCRAPRR